MPCGIGGGRAGLPQFGQGTTSVTRK
jgi:hypothetical protein